MLLACPQCTLENPLDVTHCVCCTSVLSPDDRIRTLLNQVHLLASELHDARAIIASLPHRHISPPMPRTPPTTVVNVNAQSLRRMGYRSLDAWLAASPHHKYVGRGMAARDGKPAMPGSVWGNPFKIGRDGTRDDVVQQYRDYITDKITRGDVDLSDVRGKVLGCWCKPEGCHGDVLAELADAHTE
ncbi:hypothetical protein SPRG_13005 [Saprolegnia parasitica CBS 223.65]|uniref:DUF4326 domain-containing protein n=1 Tax=Saprolegnia parasitica (strain CBS 223.65) TaxID=695850 RepID=A0A067C4H5_SAPPC|nr:hypothetical protein SPRG_13005 [Saprolegnia parasitica CBS 223.65]KDO21667.1 hypothetical protein SPRG_13005 [Saprolegnia parasitica CBS 223.65]|eukprot:XP_012207591.1 hypothetical protein SPRG_13005 [Saprolegnia parasitica CBS 223.65]